ncbi:MAG: DUF4163 domain-containing protein [Proteobacteria bacterium]|nr:DUF4163 domain-containing protein [Pseudomonadota bacterium]
MKQIATVAAFFLMLLSPALADGYDKTEKTKAYEVRLRVPAAAMAIAALKSEIMARWKKDSGDIKAQAVSDQKEMPQYFHAYAMDTNWRVTFESARLISLSGDSFIDEGGAHPNGAFDSIVWDKQANRAVPMEALFAKGRAAAAYKAIAASARATWLKTVNKESDEPTDPSMADEGIGNDAQHLGHYALTYAKGQKKANGIVLLYGAGEAWAHVLEQFWNELTRDGFPKLA